TNASNVIVTNNTVVDNSMSGILVENSSTDITVVNNITGFNGSFGVRGYDNGSGVIPRGNIATQNLAFGNVAGQFGNETIPVIDFADDNFVADPRFVDAASRDYHLGIWSAAIGAADRAFTPRTNADGVARSTANVGAY
ncbi:MAG TPA: right-handed parallel beta-helix repeat-containing protein, partial [Gaiellaceae bacterium]|nr:right-handed parallel beta-helix repeat-containing protein [Gaiellaceae bacterium]